MTQKLDHSSERGIALVSAMLIVVLAMVLSATFMLAVVNERYSSAGAHTSRRTTLAADAGVRTMQQMLSNSAQSRLDSLTNVWSGSGAIITSPGTFFAGTPVTLACANPGFNATANVTFLGSNITPASQTFDYQWTITSQATGGYASRRTVQSTGTIRVSASRASFTDYLVYTNHHTSTSGGTIWFTSRTNFNGRVHTNGELAFAYQPTFGDLVTSVSSTANYNNDGNGSLHLNADHNGTVDVPNFNGGFHRGVPSEALPSNAFSQQNAALGLDPANTTAPDNATINGRLGLGSSTSAPGNGIYLPNASGAVAGGLYVQGDLDDCLLTIDGNGRQVYTLVQGGTTKTVTVDAVNNTTRIVSGASNVTYVGVPRGALYVTGSIRNLRGPDRVSGNVVPGVAATTKLLITAEDDITITRDLTCQSYDAGQNVLGIFSSAGSVHVGTSAPNDMNLDAFVMAAGSTGIFTVDNYDQGSPRGAFHLRGGMVTQYYGAFGTFNGNTPTSGYGRDFVYDRRGTIPPYFPTTTRFTSNAPVAARQTWMEL